MKLTVTVKLIPDVIQIAALLRTMEAFNAACNYAAGIAFSNRTSNKFRLHSLVYRYLREQFGLSAQMATRAIGKAVDAYKRDTRIQPVFAPHSAMIYDDRIYSFKGVDRVSLLTLDGRIIVPILFGDYQAARMDLKRGQCDLIYRDGMFFLAVSVEVPEPIPTKPTGFIGVDFGIKNIGATSDGDTFSGKAINNVRARFSRLRSKLQRKGTKSAKRLLKKRRRREYRFQSAVNHCISKALVTRAKDSGRGIAIEDLKHIRSRITVGRAQRRVIHSWAFADLRLKIEYKARLAGVLVVAVDPRNTSRTCPVCGCIDKANRRTQSQFLCIACGFSANADVNAAGIIAGRAIVNWPNVPTALSNVQRQGQNPCL
jgi:putative transposase